MRTLPSSLLQKINKANQTIYENAQPQMLIDIYKSGMSVSELNMWYIETIREKTGLGDIAFALKRTSANKSPEMVYEIHVDDGIVKTAKKSLIGFSKSKWVDDFIVGPGKTVAIEFDGYWVKDKLKRYNLITEDLPYIFWTDGNKALWCQKWNDSSTKFQVANDVIDVATIRGWHNVIDTQADQGLICAYIKSDGKVYYRNFCEQSDKSLAWELESEITEFTPPVQNIGLFRTNDYRIGFFVESNGSISWLLTKRNWAGMAIEPEYISAKFVDISVDYIEIDFIDINVDREKITASMDSYFEYLYALSPVILQAYNINNSPTDVMVITDENLYNLDSNLSSFKITDSTNMTYYSTNIQKIDKSHYLVTFNDFHNFETTGILEYVPGTIMGDIQIFNACSVQFAPTGLIHDARIPPMPVTAYNALC